MEELRGGYKVLFWVALGLCGVDLLCMASTWLPGGHSAPEWLVTGLFLSVFPALAVAIVCGLVSGAATQLMGSRNAGQLGSYVRLLPYALKLAYAGVICLVALGFATGAGTAEDAEADASGYYYTYWDKTADPQQSVRVELTEPEYYEALKADLRISSATSAVLHAAGSFLVLASASATAGRARTAPELP
ncbi:hypothetical protein [Streptomyces drozdowiczii]|uniref:Uncharacterized protein n=1 Tax=Streptomyces drozdowiczii TaxID=202862 RepID=A0ABY6PSK0_9ACTN|nr:hypothetical protein [Streptomyces drozdowiczii]MCX0245272.1 hypothetical protein [Streptomyces drozdowiczii]UZK55062.1 hypothetical protein NEH16_13795 [Streptomyces drozdowiczii]